MDTTRTHDLSLLNALLDSWDRNNVVLLNLLRIVPAGGLQARATESSPTVSQMFMHMHHERMISVSEEAPEICPKVPDQEWTSESSPDRIAQLLKESAKAVQAAVKSRVETGRQMELNYAHPIHLIQLLIFHEGYHHGQIKLALKMAGHPISDDTAGEFVWDIWRNRANTKINVENKVTDIYFE